MQILIALAGPKIAFWYDQEFQKSLLERGHGRGAGEE